MDPSQNFNNYFSDCYRPDTADFGLNNDHDNPEMLHHFSQPPPASPEIVFVPETQAERPGRGRGRGKTKKSGAGGSSTQATEDDGVGRKTTTWTMEEKVTLVSAWVQCSEDEIQGDFQKSGEFWRKVRKLFYDKIGNKDRSDNSISGQFTEIKKNVGLFTNIYNKQARMGRQSGADDASVKSLAVGEWKDEMARRGKPGKHWNEDPLWEILRKCSKWAELASSDTNCQILNYTNEIVPHGFEFFDEPEEDEEVEPLIRRPRLKSNEATCSSPAGNSSEINIASSSNGEVKFTFSICKPPPGPTGPDAVMKRVEDIYQETIQRFGTEMSLAQVLKDICQGFTEQVNTSNNENSLIIIPKNYRVDDITRGLEKEKISLVNEVNNEKLPEFTYIRITVSRDTANVKSMLATISDENSCPDCFGDCLSREVPCACAGETGGEFAYTNEGLVGETFLKRCIDVAMKPIKEDYVYCDDCPLERMRKRKRNGSPFGLCKGHLVKTFIKECWIKCGCGMNCGNRVVQRGIQAKLQVFMTPEGKGWGLRTLEDLPRGAFVCEYVGEVVTNSELFEQKHKNEEYSHAVVLDAGWSSQRHLKDNEALYLDAKSFGNVARFINHRCVDANMVEIPIEVESLDHRYYHHAFFTTREVKAMEELTRDYGIAFDGDSHLVKAFVCKCGSKLCKAVKRYKRSRRGVASENQIVARMDLENCGSVNSSEMT